MTSSISDLIAPQLPYLRRFSRALNGSQERGDAYVVAVLEMLVADQRTFKRNLPPKISLYQLFMHVWNAIPINGRADQIESAELGAAERRIETLTPRPRQAFLLAALEEFTISEIAAILQCSDNEVRNFVDAASKEISAQIAANVLIIEDEPIIALELEALLTDIGHQVIGVATTRSEAQRIVEHSTPGLVLADIQLADGSSGIDAANDILKKTEVPLIFITAYPERLLTGERVEPTFLITKPFKPEMVKALVSQALFFDLKASAQRHKAKAI
jgi:DNA-directed RNA polymerase specialized sigma24 family protein/CheY-like chemotaxis protein